jgi:hypothetical protein
VLHKAYVGVTETGTEAAAATGIGVTTGVFFPFSPPPPVVFNADHPFLFVIRDTQSGIVLFEGQVADPTSSSADPSSPPIPQTDPVTAPVSPPIVPPPLTAPSPFKRTNNSSTLVGPITVTVAPPVLPPLTAPSAFQGTNSASPPAGPITLTVAPPVAFVPVGTAFVPVAAQSPGDLSQAQRIVTVLNHPALIDWNVPGADVMPAEAFGQVQLDSSVAAPSATSPETAD